MNFIVDENMPRDLATLIVGAGFVAWDVRDIGLSGRPDDEVFAAATVRDAIIVTRDQGFALDGRWPADFSAGVILVRLPDDASLSLINRKVTSLIAGRRPESLLGAVTFLEMHRALSHIIRRRR